MSNKAVKTLGPLNDAVCRALTLCEQFDACSEYDARERSLKEAKDILFSKIPQHSLYPAFVNKRSEFYTTYEQLCAIVRRKEPELLEQRFRKLRASSLSSEQAPAAQANAISAPPLPYPQSPVSGQSNFKMPEPNPHRGITAAAPTNHSSSILKPRSVRASSPASVDGSDSGSDTRRSQSPSTGTAITTPGSTSVLAADPDPLSDGTSAKPSFTSAFSSSSSSLLSNGRRTSPPAGTYELSPSIVRNKIAVSKTLLIDVRPHERFEQGHIKCAHIACFEPVLLAPGMSVSGLEDALVISAPSEIESFAMRDHADIIVLYDDCSQRVTDSSFLMIVHDALVKGRRRPYVLKGGFEAWKKQFPSETLSSTDSIVPSTAHPPYNHQHHHQHHHHSASTLTRPLPIPPSGHHGKPSWSAVKHISPPTASAPPAVPPKVSINHKPSASSAGTRTNSPTSSSSSSQLSSGVYSNTDDKPLNAAKLEHSLSYTALPSNAHNPAYNAPSSYDSYVKAANSSRPGSVVGSSAVREAPYNTDSRNTARRPAYNRALSGYADEPAKSVLPSLRSLPKLTRNAPLHHHSQSTSSHQPNASILPAASPPPVPSQAGRDGFHDAELRRTFSLGQRPGPDLAARNGYSDGHAYAPTSRNEGNFYGYGVNGYANGYESSANNGGGGGGGGGASYGHVVNYNGGSTMTSSVSSYGIGTGVGNGFGTGFGTGSGTGSGNRYGGPTPGTFANAGYRNGFANAGADAGAGVGAGAYGNGYAGGAESNGSATQSVVTYKAESAKPYLLSTTGLRNMGNTCYMNCILQCLMGIPQLTEPFSDGSFQNYINYRSKLGYQGRFATVFASLVRAMTEHQGGSVAPNEIKRFSGELRPDSFAGYEQQDCQEFLTFILDGLHEDLNLNGDKQKEGELDSRAEEHREAMGIRVASAIEWERYLKGDTSLIVDLFQGQYLSRLQCMTCKRTSTTYNSFSSLSLPIASPKLLGQSTSLRTCFDEFVKPEVLDGDNAWFCPNCQKKRKTVKTLRVSRLPQVLVIHLKRFKRSAAYGTNKLETPVDYPLRDLDLTRYWPQLKEGEFSEKEAEMFRQIPSRGQTPPFIYDLRAVTLHHGSLKSGHYTAVVQKPGRGWLYYDDATVYPVKEQAAVSKQAYVLFYKRRM